MDEADSDRRAHGVERIRAEPHGEASTGARSDVRASLRFALSVLLRSLFVLGLILTTQHLYSARTMEHEYLDLGNIIEGRALAPNQYRVLAPLFYAAIHHWLPVARQAAELVQVLGITACYIATTLLFLAASGSWTSMMLGQVALLGAFGYGMIWRNNQEFFEVAIVALSMLLAHRQPIRWWSLALLTLLGSLNRETHVCVIVALATTFWLDPEIEAPQRWRRIARVAALGALFAAVMFGIRAYFGLKRYHTELWTFESNLALLFDLGHPMNILYVGAGLGCAYLSSVVQGNRAYGRFILGYATALIGSSFLVAHWGEHRIFYPLLAIMIASLLRFHAETKVAR